MHNAVAKLYVRDSIVNKNAASHVHCIPSPCTRGAEVRIIFWTNALFIIATTKDGKLLTVATGEEN